MALVTSDVVKLIVAGTRTEFDRAYNERMAESVVPSIASVIQTTLPSQDYGWLGAVRGMKEFLDERQLGSLRSPSWTIADKTWEDSLEIDRKAIEDDQYGIIMARVHDLALSAADHQEELVVQALEDGFSTVCYDGQYLFDTDHSELSSGTQSNTSSDALSATSLDAAIAAMQGFKNDAGKPMKLGRRLFLVVGPKCRSRALELAKSDVVVVKAVSNAASSSGTPYINALRDMISVLVTPYISGFHWFLLDTSRAVRSIILQNRSDVPIEFAIQDDAHSSHALFMRDKIVAGVRARYNVGYGLWQMAYGSSASS